jgi:hypothetical protein
VHSEISYPKTLEIDIIYLRENSRTRNSWLPIIFAIQGAETAYFNGFTVSWTLYHTVRTQDDDYNWESLASYKDAVDYEDFHYGNLGDDIAMVMNVGGHALPIDPGWRYNFTWEFNMVPCTVGRNSIMIGSRTVVASGSYFIDVVDS